MLWIDQPNNHQLKQDLSQLVSYDCELGQRICNYLDVPDLFRLALSNTFFYDLLFNDQSSVIWRAKLEKSFDFNVVFQIENRYHENAIALGEIAAICHLNKCPQCKLPFSVLSDALLHDDAEVVERASLRRRCCSKFCEILRKELKVKLKRLCDLSLLLVSAFQGTSFDILREFHSSTKSFHQLFDSETDGYCTEALNRKLKAAPECMPQSTADNQPSRGSFFSSPSDKSRRASVDASPSSLHPGSRCNEGSSPMRPQSIAPSTVIEPDFPETTSTSSRSVRNVEPDHPIRDVLPSANERVSSSLLVHLRVRPVETQASPYRSGGLPKELERSKEVDILAIVMKPEGIQSKDNVNCLKTDSSYVVFLSTSGASAGSCPGVAVSSNLPWKILALKNLNSMSSATTGASGHASIHKKSFSGSFIGSRLSRIFRRRHRTVHAVPIVRKDSQSSVSQSASSMKSKTLSFVTKAKDPINEDFTCCPGLTFSCDGLAIGGTYGNAFLSIDSNLEYGMAVPIPEIKALEGSMFAGSVCSFKVKSFHVWAPYWVTQPRKDHPRVAAIHSQLTVQQQQPKCLRDFDFFRSVLGESADQLLLGLKNQDTCDFDCSNSCTKKDVNATEATKSQIVSLADVETFNAKKDADVVHRLVSLHRCSPLDGPFVFL